MIPQLEDKGEKEEKHKPVFLKDYERETLLANGRYQLTLKMKAFSMIDHHSQLFSPQITNYHDLMLLV